MTELKTLKDMDFSEQIFSFNLNSIENERIHNKLKQEAIKWIKQYKINNGCFDLTQEEATDCLHFWIKRFFNITEDDLNV